MHIDHVILGVFDLAAGVRELEAATGVTAVYGGKHPSWGTENALVSLGPETYLEVMAPRKGERLDPRFAGLAALEHLTPFGFAVAVSDPAGARALLAEAGVETTEPRAGSRETPSGTVLRWQTFDFKERQLLTAPFFIHWEDLNMHPARTSPGGCSLLRLDLSEPDLAALERLRRALGIAIVTHAAAKPAIAVTLRCGEQTVAFAK
jgi:hypothetical protein